MRRAGAGEGAGAGAGSGGGAGVGLARFEEALTGLLEAGLSARALGAWYSDHLPQQMNECLLGLPDMMRAIEERVATFIEHARGAGEMSQAYGEFELEELGGQPILPTSLTLAPPGRLKPHVFPPPLSVCM